MKKKLGIVLSVFFLVAIIGILIFLTYRSSESYRKKQARKGEPVAGGVERINDSDTVNIEKTQEATYENTDTEEILVNGPYGSIALSFPSTWECEICGVDDEKLMASSYGIHLKPTAETEGYIEVGYTDCFGVCGTGLETKDITVANCQAHIGYYDGNSNWEFISWPEEEHLKNITVLCNAEWGEAYLDELLEILNTLEFNSENQTGGIGIYETSSELGIDEGLLSVSAKNVSSTGATLVFHYSIYREDESVMTDELCFGSYMPIAKRVGEDWEPLAYTNDGEIGFKDVAYIIKENEETTYEYDWERLYGSLEPGEYQIPVEINSEATIYAYFILR